MKILTYTEDELKNKSGIYKITNISNGKVYVGSAVKLTRRFNDHKNQLIGHRHANKYLQNSWNKYGQESFIFEIIEFVDELELLIQREQFWIDCLNVIDNKIGYNISPTAGSTLGYKQSEETLEKKSKIMKMYFENITPEQAEKRSLNISKSKLAKNHRMSDETRRKMSIAKKGKNTGKRPKEVGEKISESKMGHTFTPLGSEHPKSIYNEELVVKIKLMLNEGLSVNEISDEFGIKPSAIYDIKSGRTWSHILPDLDLSNMGRSGKLNVKMVKEIKCLLNKGIKPIELSEMFSVSPTTIRDINRGKTWSNVVI